MELILYYLPNDSITVIFSSPFVFPYLENVPLPWQRGHFLCLRSLARPTRPWKEWKVAEPDLICGSIDLGAAGTRGSVTHGFESP